MELGTGPVAGLATRPQPVFGPSGSYGQGMNKMMYPQTNACAAAVSAGLAVWLSGQSISVSVLTGLAVMFAIVAVVGAVVTIAAHAVTASEEEERQRDRVILRELHEEMLRREADEDWRRRRERLEEEFRNNPR